jgi:hypothetical protein
MKNKFTPAAIRRGDEAADRGNDTADAMVTRRIRRGQKILSAYPLDTSDMELPDERGAKMGGSVTNVAHSLKGSSAVSR